MLAPTHYKLKQIGKSVFKHPSKEKQIPKTILAAFSSEEY